MVICTVLAVFLGIFCGLSHFDNPVVVWITNHTDAILYLLMFSVGISVGMQKGIMKKIKEYHVKIFIIPFGIITASVLGGLICAPLTGISLQYSCAITSGMGWYSLAGATIAKLGSAALGSIAFLSNLMRELFSFFIIPVIAKYCNNYTCIAPAGATSEDTTLPMILKYTNEETVVLSVLNGVICSFFVPILISIFLHV